MPHQLRSRLVIAISRSTLANMNWRRGLLLAGINLAVAVPLILWTQSRDAAYVRDFYVPRQAAETTPAAPNQVSSWQTEGVSFSPCAALSHYPTQQEIVNFTNMPAAVLLVGWRSPCPRRWQLSGILHVDSLASPTPSSIAAERRVDQGLLLLIALQWLLVGAFPLSSPGRPWREPGALITGCAALSVALVFLPPLEEVARIPAFFAVVAWFCWFALLVWRIIRSAWRWTDRRQAIET
jgi:hypothetical protein